MILQALWRLLASCLIWGMPLSSGKAACLFINGKGYTLKEALTPAALQKGLMGVTDLDKDQGMIFSFPDNRPVSFWMKNTPLSLDILFIDVTYKIQHLHKGAQPFSLQPISSHGPVRWVIELKAGLADHFNLKAGTYVHFTFNNNHC